MGYRVDFIGMINFFDLKPQGRLVLLPNGRTDLPEGIPPHFASFFVEEARLQSANWEFEQDPQITARGLREFPIESRSTISITGQEETSSSAGNRVGDLDTRLHAHLLPRLREIDPDIRIDPDKADIIARLPLRHGVLEAMIFGGGAVSRLTLSAATGPVTVTATPEDGSAVKSFTFEEGAEIVLSNISDPFAKHGDEDIHFQLYAKLDEKRKADKLKKEPPLTGELAKLEMVHPYLRFILRPVDFPMPGCSNTGCCAGQLVRTT